MTKAWLGNGITVDQLEDLLRGLMSLISMEERYETRQNSIDVLMKDSVTDITYVITGITIENNTLVFTIDPKF